MNPIEIVLAGLMQLVEATQKGKPPKPPKLDGSQKFNATQQTEMFNNRGKLRDFTSPGRSANQVPTTSNIRTGPPATLNPPPQRTVPAQGQMNMFTDRPGGPQGPREATQVERGRKSMGNTRGPRRGGLGIRDTARGLKNTVDSQLFVRTGKGLPKIQGLFNKGAGGGGGVASLIGYLGITALNQAIAAIHPDPQVKRRLNQALTSYWSGNVDEAGRVLDIDGLPIEGGRTPKYAVGPQQGPQSTPEGRKSAKETAKLRQQQKEAEEAKRQREEAVAPTPITPILPPPPQPPAIVPSSKEEAPVSAPNRQQLRNLDSTYRSPYRGQLR